VYDRINALIIIIGTYPGALIGTTNQTKTAQFWLTAVSICMQPMADQQSHSGLGYARIAADASFPRNNEQQQPIQESTTSNSIDDLMLSYMQQCLQYHEQQQADSDQQQFHGQGGGQSCEVSNISATTSTHRQPLHLSFVPPTNAPEQKHNECERVSNPSDKNHHSEFTHGNGRREESEQGIDRPAATSKLEYSQQQGGIIRGVRVRPKSPISETKKEAPDHNTNDETMAKASNPEFQKALAKAKAIAQRIATGDGSGGNASNVGNESSYPYAQKRHEFLTQHHSKLNTFLLNNFQYLAERDEEQLQRQLNHLQSFQELHQKELLQKQQQKLTAQERTRKRAPANLAGVGSESRCRKHGNPNASKNSNRSSTTSCGIYITGLRVPRQSISTSTSVSPTPETRGVKGREEQDEQELVQSLHQLFESFGKVSNVKLYKDKLNGRTKGDGLIQYDWNVIRRKYETDDEHGCLDNPITGASADTKIGPREEEMEQMRSFLEMVCQQVSACV
jgi:hypothetical protein